MSSNLPILRSLSLDDAPSLTEFLGNLRSRPPETIARRWDIAKVGYEHPDLGDEPRPDPFALANIALARQVGETLQLHYPGHPWAVEVEIEHGIVKVGIPMLMGWVAWYVVHVATLKSDPGMKIVIKAGGEILERYQIPRNRYDYFQFAEACSKVSTRDQRRGIVPE